MSRTESKTLSIMEDKQLLTLMDMVNTGVVDIQVGTSIVDEPLTLNNKVKRNKIMKYHKYIIKWAMDEWLVVEKVQVKLTG